MSPDQRKPFGATGKLDNEERHTLIIPALGTYDTRFASQDVVFQPVPHNYKSIPSAPVWRILLKFGSTGVKTIAGLEIHADVSFGRGSGDPDSPDVDLTYLGALERGVSRRHALLRPTANKLYIIDLNSTNGTFVNAIPVSRGMAQTIRNHDALALAGLNCIIEIVASPSVGKGTPIPESAHSTAGLVDVSPPAKLNKPAVGQQTISGVKLSGLLKELEDSSSHKPPVKPADPDTKKK